MKKFENAIGIDVSKATLDLYDFCNEEYYLTSNTPKGYEGLLKWVRDHNMGNVILCFEHTGAYSLPLSIFLDSKGVDFVMVPGLEIKRSMGIRRNKNDKADARYIAEYAYLRRNAIKTCQLPGEAILKLKGLLNLRARMVKQRSGYKVALQEVKTGSYSFHDALWSESQHALIGELKTQINAVQVQMQKIIQTDKDLQRLYALITSIVGIGPITATGFLVYTNGFSSFKNWRTFASFCGTAPFSNTSGTSIRGKDKVSHLANKKMKTLLSIASASSIQYNKEIKEYYRRRIKEGKNKMSTLNIIRNKLIARVFAVVQRGTPYVELNRHIV